MALTKVFIAMTFFAMISCPSFGARVAVGRHEVEDDAEEGGCPGILARRVCVEPNEYLLENIGGHSAGDLKCLATWCKNGKDNCCQTLGGLRNALDGKTAIMLKLKDGIYEKLQAAAALATDDMNLKVQEKVEEKKEYDPANTCYCPTGDRRGTYAPYSKSHPTLQGKGGGVCAKDSPCQECSHVDNYHHGRYTCCEMKADGEKGECGAMIKEPEFGNSYCTCSGYQTLKRSLWLKNPECLPETSCSQCSPDCA